MTNFAQHPSSKLWHPTKNGTLKPENLAVASHERAWFQCHACKHDFEAYIFNISSGQVKCAYCANQKLCKDEACELCFSKSFAASEKAKYWHAEKNGELRPRHCFLKMGKKKIWFTCQDCKHDFDAVLDDISSKGSWCSYCANKKLCSSETCDACFKKSFASHSKAGNWHPTKNGSMTPRSCFLTMNSPKIWFTCEDCKHDFEASLGNVVANSRWCPYCANQKLCLNKECYECLQKSFASHPRFKQWHATKNSDADARQLFRNKNKPKYWFTCETCDKNFELSLKSVSFGRWCVFCRNKTETLVRDFCKKWATDQEGVTVLDKATAFEWCKKKQKLPFDIVLTNQEKPFLIVEVDGRQHFESGKMFGCSTSNCHNLQRDNDIYKMVSSFKQGIPVIRIAQEDVWADKWVGWKEALLKALEEGQTAFLGEDATLYDEHRASWQEAFQKLSGNKREREE